MHVLSPSASGNRSLLLVTQSSRDDWHALVDPWPVRLCKIFSWSCLVFAPTCFQKRYHQINNGGSRPTDTEPQGISMWILLTPMLDCRQSKKFSVMLLLHLLKWFWMIHLFPLAGRLVIAAGNSSDETLQNSSGPCKRLLLFSERLHIKKVVLGVFGFCFGYTLKQNSTCSVNELHDLIWQFYWLYHVVNWLIISVIIKLKNMLLFLFSILLVKYCILALYCKCRIL